MEPGPDSCPCKSATPRIHEITEDGVGGKWGKWQRGQ